MWGDVHVVLSRKNTRLQAKSKQSTMDNEQNNQFPRVDKICDLKTE